MTTAQKRANKNRGGRRQAAYLIRLANKKAAGANANAGDDEQQILANGGANAGDNSVHEIDEQQIDVVDSSDQQQQQQGTSTNDGCV